MLDDAFGDTIWSRPNDGKLRELLVELHQALSELKAAVADEVCEKSVCLASRAAFTEFSAIYEIDFQFHGTLGIELRELLDDAMRSVQSDRYKNAIQQRIDDLNSMEQHTPEPSDTSV